MRSACTSTCLHAFSHAFSLPCGWPVASRYHTVPSLQWLGGRADASFSRDPDGSQILEPSGAPRSLEFAGAKESGSHGHEVDLGLLVVISAPLNRHAW